MSTFLSWFICFLLHQEDKGSFGARKTLLQFSVYSKDSKWHRVTFFLSFSIAWRLPSQEGQYH